MHIFLANFILAFTLYDFSRLLSTILLFKRSWYEFNECTSQLEAWYIGIPCLWYLTVHGQNMVDHVLTVSWSKNGMSCSYHVSLCYLPVHGQNMIDQILIISDCLFCHVPKMIDHAPTCLIISIGLCMVLTWSAMFIPCLTVLYDHAWWKLGGLCS